MAYRLCKSTGVIHAYGADYKKVCKDAQDIHKGNYIDCLTKSEAEAEVRQRGKPPRYCKHCDFRDALQAEANQ